MVDVAIQFKSVSKSFEIRGLPLKGSRGASRCRVIEVLNDVSLSINKGEIIGIIGRNGSGKSTLLSMIAKILMPTSGSITINGEVAAILELGMGFHLDMTGRENIYLKGEMYGFSRNEMDEKIEDIISYSGISKYIDNPVRTYSSGMTSRLAFSIMVHVDAEIMLVDEVLSVGDASFIEKAKQHFKQLSKSGKTILIASHSIHDIEAMCNRTIWIENGTVFRDGPTQTVCSEYLNCISESPEILLDLANSGVSSAQYKVSRMYRDGVVVPQDMQRYFDLLKDSALQGFIPAQVEYADMLLSEGNKEDALVFYRNAASRGDKYSQSKIAMVYGDDGGLISKIVDVYCSLPFYGDPKKLCMRAELLLMTATSFDEKKQAYDLFCSSADLGNQDAMYQVAIMNRDGNGTNRDVNKMKMMLEMASDLGHMPSILLLADLYAKGTLLSKDDSKSFNYYLRAARLGNPFAMFTVGSYYSEGVGVDCNVEMANVWYRNYSFSTIYKYLVDIIPAISTHLSKELFVEFNKALGIQGNTWAIGNLLNYNVSNGLDSSEYIQQLIELASNYNLDAVRRLALIYYDGTGVDVDYAESLKWFETGSRLGDPWCTFRASEMYRDGKGAARDVEKAVRMMSDSAVRGQTPAAGGLLSIYASGTVNDPSVRDLGLASMRSMAESGILDAVRRLALIYYDGTGVDVDYAESLKWFETGSRLGDPWCESRAKEIRDCL